uniref:Uncharacterized protein n=1 Tax=Myoviridae sp. ctshb19 TaxID=2825194 RepID=A0A8S5UGM0_9CAUD|nr:MAG TPA: hypothetical protein [Myoviridae sp. ctshb19]
MISCRIFISSILFQDFFDFAAPQTNVRNALAIMWPACALRAVFRIRVHFCADRRRAICPVQNASHGALAGRSVTAFNSDARARHNCLVAPIERRQFVWAVVHAAIPLSGLLPTNPAQGGVVFGLAFGDGSQIVMHCVNLGLMQRVVIKWQLVFLGPLEAHNQIAVVGVSFVRFFNIHGGIFFGHAADGVSVGHMIVNVHCITFGGDVDSAAHFFGFAGFIAGVDVGIKNGVFVVFVLIRGQFALGHHCLSSRCQRHNFIHRQILERLVGQFLEENAGGALTETEASTDGREIQRLVIGFQQGCANGDDFGVAIHLVFLGFSVDWFTTNKPRTGRGHGRSFKKRFSFEAQSGGQPDNHAHTNPFEFLAGAVFQPRFPRPDDIGIVYPHHCIQRDVGSNGTDQQIQRGAPQQNIQDHLNLTRK